jgi:prephenate dehydrogenase
LKKAGWNVSGTDLQRECVDEAILRGLIDDETFGAECDLLVICTPAGTVADVATHYLNLSRNHLLIATDVAGVKSSIVSAVSDGRFIGGHPMAGSEMQGIAGARADLFEGTTWVLTPTSRTETESYSRLLGYIRNLGASVMALDAQDHDRLMAMASHVPHLVSGALMNEAAAMSKDDNALLRLAAGGFRDMTRISAGDPTIWPDVLFENSEAVLEGLIRVSSQIEDLRSSIEHRDRVRLLELLERAAVARRNLPGRAVAIAQIGEIRVLVTDRPGVLSEITTLASDLNVNIYDISISHTLEGNPGVLSLSVGLDLRDSMLQALGERGYSASVGTPS